MTEWEWPQYVVVGCFVLSVILHASKHGEQREPFNGPIRAIWAAFAIWILYMGGFWG